MPFFRTEQRDIIRFLYPDDYEDYTLLLESFGEFCGKEILPTSEKIDREKTFPRENLRKLFAQGLTSMSFPKQYDGLELPYPVYVAAMEMVSKACASTALSIAIHGTVCEGIREHGNDEIKERYLRPLIKGEKLAAFALTEPESGSDAGAMRTQAVRKGDEFVLNGSKMFITNAGEADVYFVFARTEKGYGAFLIDKDTEGFSVGKNIDKLGFRGTRLMELILNDCRVPKDNVVGVDSEGFEYAKRMLNGGRITVGAIAVGIAQIAYDKSLKYSRERFAFGKPIANFQLIQAKLADMLTEINAARLMTYFAARLKDEDRNIASEAAQAKLFASEVALRVCDEAIQIHGGYGYADEFNIHRHWRDAKLSTIGEGTSEILRLLIARSALKRAQV